MTHSIIMALSGLGMFLFGMLYMEQALKEFAGVKFKKWIKNSTNTTTKALLTGAGATALLQSSSVITLMTLSFVSASLISLQGGIGLIFGANIGTTATAWLVAIVGFKVKIESFALPMIGFGGIVIMFLKNQKLIAIAKIFVGFGLLFMGLDILKTAVESSAKGIDLSEFTHYSLFIFLLLGLVITAIIQSSSAATAIVLTALSTHILSFEMAAAMVIGTNIGTTATALLGSIGGVPDKKRVAIAHFLFNVITAVVAFVFLSSLSYLILEILGFKNDTVTALALFHTLFNVLGVIILTPFIPKLAQFLNSLFESKKEIKTKYIHLVDPIESNGAMIAVRNEISNLFSKSVKFSLLIFNLKPIDIFSNIKNDKEILKNASQEIEFDYKKGYETLKEIEIETTKYLNKINQLPLSELQSLSLNTLYSSLRESIYACKIVKDIKNNIQEFSTSDNESINYYYDLIRINFIHMIQNILSVRQNGISIDTVIEQHNTLIKSNEVFINRLTRNFEKENIEQSTVVSLLNSNRTVIMVMNSFLEAVKVVGVVFEIDNEEEI